MQRNPKAFERKQWQVFDEEADSVLEATLAGSIEKMKAMTTIMYRMGRKRFDIIEHNARRAPTEQNNRRENKNS